MDAKENIFCYFVGTAGAGKSTATDAYARYLKLRGLDPIIVNLDPGAESLPYEPDVDIRDWIKLSEVMTEHDLGPNGAQVAAADMLALNLEEVKSTIDDFRADNVLIDTPGQIELFVFREAGRHVVRGMNPDRSFVAYMMDPMLARTPSGFTSLLMLGATTTFRLGIPMASLLAKGDLLSFQDIDEIGTWAQNEDALYDAVTQDEPNMEQAMSAELVRGLGTLGGYPGVLPVSAKSGEGWEDLYNTIQAAYGASEDLLSD